MLSAALRATFSVLNCYPDALKLLENSKGAGRPPHLLSPLSNQSTACSRWSPGSRCPGRDDTEPHGQSAGALSPRGPPPAPRGCAPGRRGRRRRVRSPRPAVPAHRRRCGRRGQTAPGRDPPGRRRRSSSGSGLCGQWPRPGAAFCCRTKVTLFCSGFWLKERFNTVLACCQDNVRVSRNNALSFLKLGNDEGHGDHHCNLTGLAGRLK